MISVHQHGRACVPGSVPIPATLIYAPPSFSHLGSIAVSPPNARVHSDWQFRTPSPQFAIASSCSAICSCERLSRVYIVRPSSHDVQGRSDSPRPLSQWQHNLWVIHSSSVHRASRARLLLFPATKPSTHSPMRSTASLRAMTSPTRRVCWSPRSRQLCLRTTVPTTMMTTTSSLLERTPPLTCCPCETTRSRL